MNRKTVKVRDLVLGDGVPKICVPVVAHTAPELEHVLGQIDPASFDLLEFRADFYFDDVVPALARIRDAAGNRPVLFTLRTKEEGGEIGITEEEYERRNLEAAPYADLVDIQLERLHAGAEDPAVRSGIIPHLHEAGALVVGSWHSFSGTPEVSRIVRQLVRMQEAGCDITKAAVMPSCREDVIKLLSASLEMDRRFADRPYITMSMGPVGRVTRAACAFSGSCVTFGMAGEASAPGQIPAAELRRILKALG